MANEEHLAILRQGVTAWNQWRGENPSIFPDLSGADLRGANLRGANLRRANLQEACLDGADLSEADLSKTDFTDADLVLADLNGSDLSGAVLLHSDLDSAIFSGACLSDADISCARLGFTDFSGADLRRADLSATSLHGSNLQGSNLNGTVIRSTSFANVDLSQVKGLESVIHNDPSSIGVDTLGLTLRGAGGRFTEEQLVFFEGAGVPATLLDYLPSILESNPLQFYNCFISYSTLDEEFAEPLNQDLNEAGIKTWKWDRDAVRGRNLAQSIDLAIKNHDETILVCSVDSLTSPQVEREIQQALDKEVRIKTANIERRKEALAKGEPPPTVDADVLIPIRLDETIFNWDSYLKGEVTRRMVADFTDAPPGSDKYNRELQQLIKALNPTSWPPSVAISQS